MNIQEKKASLKEYGTIKNKLRRLEEEKFEIISRGISTVARLNDMPKGTDITDKVGNTSVELEMIDEEIDEVKRRLIEKRKEIERGIDTLDNELQKDVIFMKYMMLLSFDTIASSVDRDRRTVARIHGQALQKIFL